MMEDDLFGNNTYDPLAELNEAINTEKIHIRITKRNARKSICTIEKLNMEKSELKPILKNMKKNFACNGCIIDDDQHGLIIQLQGDVREKAKEMLIQKYNIKEENIVTHGYD